ncbi:MAG TPA: DUF503 domain-containing protein [Acidimicrobiia bacterium]|nr:DUF503 domain-containing protein [Acidimicrobiia bacterium]
MRAAALRFELFLPNCGSLKEKRAVLRPITEGLRRRLSVSVAEVGYQNAWQRSVVGVALVAADGARLESQIERVRRYVEDNLEVEVCEVAVYYSED